MRLDLPADLRRDVDALLADWESGAKVARLWDGDASLWTGSDESRWLGWLTIPSEQMARREELLGPAEQARAEGFEHALVLGMGGSSLCPEVLATTFGPAAGHPRLHILDSTDPVEVLARERQVPLARTLFIVSSKSGTTLETDILMRHFLQRVSETVGAERASGRFIAITDPGSTLAQEAGAHGFRAVVDGVKAIGGRYSALSAFGMAPGAIAGVDVIELLERGRSMAAECGPDNPGPSNPGLLLGIVLGAAHNTGRDKLTLVAAPRVAGMGAWIEQLVAESTGKDGRGIMPVDGEPVGDPDLYGEDRLFAQLRLAGDADERQDAAVEALARAGRPVVRIELDDPLDLGGQFFLWEFATAVAGSVIGVNPFDQPDVEAAKVRARELTAGYERSGSLPPAETDSESSLEPHLRRLEAGDYLGLLAFVPRTLEHQRELDAIRLSVRDRMKVATTVGFGPRYLHSTGQAHKGGPPGGVFLQLTCDDADDIPVPGRAYTFGIVKAAQARGDFDVLTERGRRLLRLHLGTDVAGGLKRIRAAAEEATR